MPSPTSLLGASNLLRLDGLVSLGFGLAISVFPGILSTAFDFSTAGSTGDGASFIERTWRAMAGYYVFAGAAQVALAGAPRRFVRRLCLLVALHHAYMAGWGVVSAEEAWMLDPWADVAIHLAFAGGYLWFVWWGELRRVGW